MTTDTEWVMVPRAPTLEMQYAYFDVIDRNMARVQTDPAFGRFDNNREAYRAMLSASPPSPRVGPAEEEVARVIDPVALRSFAEEEADILASLPQGVEYPPTAIRGLAADNVNGRLAERTAAILTARRIIAMFPALSALKGDGQ